LEESGIEKVYSGANEKAPKCKRILTLKAGKKKGKKKKSGSLNQLEGIMRKVVDLDHYEYPGRKLTESDEELEARMKGKRSEEDCILETQFMETLKSWRELEGYKDCLKLISYILLFPKIDCRFGSTTKSL